MQAHPGSGETGTGRGPARSLLSAKVGLVLASALVSLVIIEVGFRLAAGLPVFKLANWRTEQVVMNTLGERALVDPVLGWTLKPWNQSDDYSTIDHGIRRSFDETAVRTGAILAVGDSYTEGWEVDDDESWPAYLEKFTGVPVVNAGVGGYGTDQIVLRAEQMLAVVKPKILLVGFLEYDIFRAGHSVFGAPKPYFTLANGELRYHPPGRIELRRPGGPLSSLAETLRDPLGYSAAADYVLARLHPSYWYSTSSRAQDRKVDIDAAAVTCALLRRLKTATDRDDVKLMLFMQYYAPVVLASDKPSYDAQRVVDCSQAMGIRVVDQFASLRTIAAADPVALRDYYMSNGTLYSHMSAIGNEHAANLLAPALRDWLPLVTGSSQTAATPPSADEAPNATE
ncbi:MAG: hypothetical protein QOC56_2906 [Alphaproteobacteria bacterium]|nr:hypothetical protein [Alphaproteobacteria bacterium]